MEAEKHVMRAQLRDLMEKQRAEVQRLSTEHQELLEQGQQDLQAQLEELRRASSQLAPGHGPRTTDPLPSPRLAELEGRGSSFGVQSKIKSLSAYYSVYFVAVAPDVHNVSISLDLLSQQPVVSYCQSRHELII